MIHLVRSGHPMVRCLTVAVLVLIVAQAKATPAEDPLAALLEYAQAMEPPKAQPGTVRRMGPEKFFKHPYASRSLTGRMLGLLGKPADPSPDPGTVFLQEIRDAKLVEEVLARSGEGGERLRALAEIHPLTIMSRDEIEVLGEILREMVRAGYPRKSVEAVFGLIRELEPFVQMNPDFPSFSSRLLELERICVLARQKKAGPAEKQMIQAFLQENPLDPEVLYGAACALALSGEPDQAKDLLARLAILDQRLPIKVGKDSDLTTVRSDTGWMESLGKGELRPRVEPAAQPGVEEMTIHYHWGGMGDGVDETRTLSWKKDRYVESGKGTEVPAWLVQLLMKEIAEARPSDSLQSRITHYDDYPSLEVTLSLPDGSKTLLYSGSNSFGMLPFNIAGKQGLQVTNSRLAGQAMRFLMNWLRIKRGSPRASFHFGGMEIPKGERRQPVSPAEAAFRKQAGLPENPPPPEPEPLPPELAGVPGQVRLLDRSYVTDEEGNPAVDVDRYLVEPREGESGCTLSLIRARRREQTLWYPEPPAAFVAHAAEAHQRLQAVLGTDLPKCQIRPWLRSLDEDGFPSGGDLVEALGFVSQIDAELSALGPNPVRIKILADTPDLRFEGSLLLGSGTIFSNDFEVSRPPFDHPLPTSLLAWAGIGPAQHTAIRSLMLRNNMLYLDLVASPTASDLETMKQGIAAAGRTLTEVDQAVSRGRWLVKPAADERLHYLIGRDGKLEFHTLRKE